jgi:coenzyme PQQ precursor peptide PqqA
LLDTASLRPSLPRGACFGKNEILRQENLKEHPMAWTTPEICEVCVGMEVTSYASAEI